MKIVSALFITAFASTLFAAVVPLKPGQYELVSEFSMPGRAGGAPPRKDQHCYTAKELEDLPKNIAAGKDGAQNCKVLDLKTTGATIAYTTECANPDGTHNTIKGETTFTSAESFRSVVNMNDASGRGASPFKDLTITISGKRIGDCAK